MGLNTSRAEFAHNQAPSKATIMSPFKVIYGIDRLGPLDLVSRPLYQKPSAYAKERVEEIQKIRGKLKPGLRNLTCLTKHKKKLVFQPGDLIWIHLQKEGFPSKRKSKLMPIADDPFKVLE